MKKTAVIILAVLLGWLIFVHTSSAAHYCNQCHKEIKTQWLTVDGNYYHPNHFNCTNCLAPITGRNFYERDGNYYDSVCFANFISKKCDYCYKPILEEAIYFDSKVYHTDCYNNHAGMRCIVCKNVVSLAFFVDKLGNAVCKNHKDIAQSCFSCQRYLPADISGEGEQYRDDRIICNHCLTTAVEDIDQAYDLIEEIKWQLEFSGIVIDQEFELSFVSLDDLNKNFDKYMVDHLGITHFEKSEYLGGLIETRNFEIRVLYGLPRAQLREVLAHELMHVWLFQNAPQPQEPELCEGSCQYAAYLVMQYDTTSDGVYFLEHLKNQDDPVYGQGFREVYRYVNKYGLEKWLEYLKKNTKAPW